MPTAEQRRQILPFYLYSFFNHLFPFYAVYTVLINERLQSPFLLSTLLAAWSLTVVILEVPSGMFADYWSRKWIIFLGQVAKVGVTVIWFLADDYSWFLAGFVLWGIQESFCSGAVDALLYEGLQKQGQADQYERIYSICYRLTTIAVPLAIFGGGVLYRTVPDAVFIISFITSIFTTGIVLCFSGDTDDKDPEGAHTSLMLIFKEASEQLLTTPLLLRLFLFSTLCITMVGAAEEFVPVIIDSFGFTAVLFGTCLAIIIFAQTIGGFLSRKVMLRNEAGLYLTGAVMIGVMVATSLVSGLIAVILWVIIFGMVGLLEIKVNVRINNLVSSQRATVLSISSLTINVSAIIITLLIGILTRMYSLSVSIALCSIGIIILFAVLLFCIRSKK